MEQKERRGQQYKKERRRENERERERERSVSAGGDLLQVLDTLLVNQTDSEGGQVEDEAFLELDGKTKTPECYRLDHPVLNTRGRNTAQPLTSSTHIFRRSTASSLLRSATTNTPGEQVEEGGVGWGRGEQSSRA